jgi:AAA+ ATPase superfamily predicted ATPase
MRLLVINTDDSTTEKVYRNLRKILADYRISMDVQVIDNEEKQLTEEEIIQRESSETDLTVLGLRRSRPRTLDLSVRRVHRLVQHLGSALIIDGSSQFEDLDAGLQEEEPAETDPADQEEIALPQVPASRWSTVTADLQKIDANAERVLRLLHEKAIAPWFVAERRLVSGLRDIATGLSVSLERAVQFAEPFRQRKAIRRITNDYLFRCRALVKTIADDVLPAQHDRLGEALQWYADRLEQDVRRFPSTIRLDFPREEFIPHRTDGAVLAVRKLWKRLLHAIVGYPAGCSIPYRMVAEHFLLHRRHAFLTSYLKRFLKESAASLTAIRGEMVELSERLQELEKEVGVEEMPDRRSDGVFEAFRKGLDESEEESHRRSRLFRNRLFLEFRKNLISMQGELDHFGVRQRLKKRRVPPKIYRQLVRSNGAFSMSWMQEITLVSNKISVDVAVASLHSRVYDRTAEFVSLVHQEIDSHLTAPLARMQESLAESVKGEAEESIELTLDQAHTIPESFDEAHDEILELTRNLPEKLTVKGQDDATGDAVDEIDVPLISLTQHYIESKFLSPVQEVLTDASEKLRKTGFSVKDHLNLARYGVDSIEPDVSDRAAASTLILKKALDHLSREAKVLEAIKEEIAQKTRGALESAFQPLAPHLIVDSTVSFTDAYRDYASKRVFSRFGALLRIGWNFVEDRLIRLIYSRSEGLLFARRITRPAPSTASNLLTLVHSLSPTPEVLKSLPQFYINLFSGRSSVGGDFWVPRQREERAFEEAVRRYRDGSHGAILVIGDRNSGKTSLCRRFGLQHFSKGRAFHVFPPRTGSIASDSLERALGQATGFRGTPGSILRSIPHGSVLFFHDLELWFERHAEGTGVIEKILKQIEKHAQDVLIVMNTNPGAYELLRQLVPLQEVCIEQITLSPMDAEDLKEMILRRHTSSGMHFFLGRRAEQSLSRFSLARLFDLYFVCSDGNPGVALNRWLSSITRVNGDELRMRPPELPSTGALETLSDDALITLMQYVIHKRLTPAKLARITGSAKDATRRTANRMTAIGLLEEKFPDLFTINPVLDLPVRKTLRERRLL